MKTGILTLVPTPIDEENPLEEVAKKTLLKAIEEKRDKTLFVHEDPKVSRRRWLKWGLPRELISDFVYCNEHNYKEVSTLLLNALKGGTDVYLMSDCGLPAFMDPGQELVDLCHKAQIQVTSTPFPNSIALSIALSGFSHRTFFFAGFLSAEKMTRKNELKNLLKDPNLLVLMDTPYRLKNLLIDLKEVMENLSLTNHRQIFLALDLNTHQEQLLRGTVDQLMEKLDSFRREFILIIAPLKK